MLLTVIAAALPLTVPQYMGYQIYDVVSGSMEPTVPVGSIIYVKEAEPSSIKKGDIIAFQSGESIVMHRVVDNKIVEGTFTTKGDANPSEDMNEVPYANLIVWKYFGPSLHDLLCRLRSYPQYSLLQIQRRDRG